MKHIAIILLLLLATSCGSFRTAEPQISVRTVNFDQQFYAFNTYDYNYIHFMWQTDPYFFYNNGYFINGIYQPFYLHPFFNRYCRFRNFTPNHNYYINNTTRVNTRRVTSTRNTRVITRRDRTVRPRNIRATTTRRANTTRATTTRRVNTTMRPRSTMNTRSRTVQPRRSSQPSRSSRSTQVKRRG